MIQTGNPETGCRFFYLYARREEKMSFARRITGRECRFFRIFLDIPGHTRVKYHRHGIAVYIPVIILIPDIRKGKEAGTSVPHRR